MKICEEFTEYGECDQEATYFGPDPYELNEHNEVALCESCRHQRYMDN